MMKYMGVNNPILHYSNTPLLRFRSGADKALNKKKEITQTSTDFGDG